MKRKFLILLLIGLFSLCGCSNIKNMNTDSLLNELANKAGKYNEVNRAFKYYLPSGLSIDSYDDYNAVFSSANYKYYLYVDLISYYKKVEFEYDVNNKAFYSKKIDFDNKTGYIEINLKENDKYLIEIMYNYAKIEVMVDYDDINLAVLNAVTILRDLEYNDMTIESIASNKSQKFNDETYNIFNPKGNDNNYLDIIQNEDDTNAEENEEIDTDLVK